ncbi:MAG: glycosyltransferase family 39 protein [Candidatus Micrarchaeota archaeon]|nr:glycosyltransferase family 39 protein [Candidatus Micrarchaeota archaeon]
MVEAKIRVSSNRQRLLAIAFIVLLIMAVRIYYYSGPIFANTQDEGIYLTTFAQHIKFGNSISFSQYRGVNFSDHLNGLFNPAQSFQFYVGLEYPIMFLMSVFGYSANLAIWYVMFTSLVEGILVFLIAEKLAGIRAGLISASIFAFMPVDVLFGTHVQPLVPMAMMITASVYAFILAEESKGRRRYMLYLLAGLFAGFAYITNPLSLLLPAFLLLYTIFHLATMRKGFRRKTAEVCLMAVGFVVAYSTIGIVYLYSAGNFLLYPMITRAEFTYIMLTQALGTYCAPALLSHQVCAQYAVGLPTFYLRLLANQAVPSSQYLTYYGYSFFAFATAILTYIFAMRSDKKLTRVWFFTAMFLFYLMAVSFFPMSLKSEGARTVIFMADQQPYYSVLFVLPMVVVLGLVLDALIRRGESRPVVIAVACAVALVVIGSNVLVLNHDVAVYRDSMYTMHAFIGFTAAHPSDTFYTEWIFSNNANLLSGYRYKINQLSCGSPLQVNSSATAYIATGGTISMDMDPGIMQGYDTCLQENLTNSTVAYAVQNPFQPSSPLRILKIG